MDYQFVPYEKARISKKYRKLVLIKSHGKNTSEQLEFLAFNDTRLCCYCGEKLTRKSYTIDHVYPKGHGGKNNISNKVSACLKCNLDKSDKLPLDYLINNGLPIRCY